MGPLGEAQGAGAAKEGVKLPLYAQFWWTQNGRGNPYEPLGHPGLRSEVIQMPGLRHTAKPLPGSQQLSGLP